MGPEHATQYMHMYLLMCVCVCVCCASVECTRGMCLHGAQEGSQGRPEVLQGVELLHCVPSVVGSMDKWIDNNL